MGVVIEGLKVLFIQLDNGLVGSDALGGDRLGEDGASAGDYLIC